jgi:trimeric autotransporter adhesin
MIQEIFSRVRSPALDNGGSMRRVLWLGSLLLVAGIVTVPTAPLAATVLQTCTAQNVAGYPYSGTLCGGGYADQCSPGELYTCTGGPRGTLNNCTLNKTCSVACLTGVTSSPVTLNTTTPTASDACFSGAAPLTLSSSSVVGGSVVTFTATLAATHSPYAIVNVNGLSNLVGGPCENDIPIELAPTATSISIPLPTAVVSSTSQASPWTLISYNDARTGVPLNLVSLTQALALAPGGSTTPPSLASFELTDTSGNPITSIAGGASVLTQGTLSGLSPYGGVNVRVTTSPTGAFTPAPGPGGTTDGSFIVPAACTSSLIYWAGVLAATSANTSNIAATATATDGTGSPLTANITITPPPLKLTSIIFNPGPVTGGSTSTVTVGTNRAVNGTDPTATVTIRVSEGNFSGNQIATFPGCTGSPACTGPVTIAVGASSASVTLSTSAVASQDAVTITASAPWSNQEPGGNLIINAGPCTPKTCSSLGFNCGSASNACGGTLNCGTCSAGQSCISNVCSGSGSVTLASLILSPRSVKGGNSSTGTVTLSAAAPAGGAVVTTSSSNTVATVPSSVTVAAGSTSATFTVSTQRPSADTTVTISATFNGTTKTAALTVTRR